MSRSSARSRKSVTPAANPVDEPPSPIQTPQKMQESRVRPYILLTHFTSPSFFADPFNLPSPPILTFYIPIAIHFFVGC